MRKFKILFITLLIALWGLNDTVTAQDTPPALPDEPTQQQPAVSDESEGRRLFVKGITEFELENYEEAAEFLVAARERLGSSPGIDFAIADAYFALYDYAAAIEYAMSAVEADGENKWYRIRLAEIYQDSGQNDKAVAEYKKLVDQHPYNLEILYDLARALTLDGELVEANRTFDRILNLTGPDMQVYYQKYRNFNTLGQQDSAIVQLELMLDLEPDNPAAAQTLSEKYIEREEYDKAIELLEKALERNPDEHEIIVSLSDIYIRKERWEDAADLLDEILRSSRTPQITKVELTQYFLGRLSRDPYNSDLANAAGHLIETLKEVEPDFGYTHALAAEYYSFLEDEERLLEALRQTNRLLPDNEPAWRQRLQIYLSKGEYEKTIEAGKEADQAIPDDAFVLFFTGNAYFLTDQTEEAIEWLTRASSAPANRDFRSVALTTLGDAHASVEDWEQADESYEQALRLNPDNDVALNNFAYYLSTRSERLDEALEMAEKAIAAEPNNAAYLDTIGWIHFKLGNLDQARDYIRASIDTGEASAVVLEHLGDVYEEIGDMDEARKWWRKAVDKDSSKEHLLDKIGDS